MGKDSKHLRYRNAGEEMNQTNLEKYGQPDHSLFMASKFFSLHQRNDICNDKEEVVYKNLTKFISLHDTTTLLRANDEKIAVIRRKIFTIHSTHKIKLADGFEFKLKKELFHIYKKVIRIVGLDWKLKGNMFRLNFELLDADGSVIATVSQKFISLHDKYSIDIYKPEYEDKVVAIVVCLQHMIRDKERSQYDNNN